LNPDSYKHLKGEGCPTAKLTEDQVKEIRNEYAGGKSGGYRPLARKYGMGMTAIASIITRKTWIHV
jgi:Mor family transcriptional regulator